MYTKTLPDQALLRKLLDYDSRTGLFMWKPRPVEMFRASTRSADCWMRRWNTRYAGKRAFAQINDFGYHHGSINGMDYVTARVAWKWETGEEPTQIDHINGNRSDNRFSNLRNCSHTENGRNRGLAVNNTSGHAGVWQRKGDGKWCATITRQLGSFDTKEEAVAARLAAQAELGYHPSHGTRPSRRRKGGSIG